MTRTQESVNELFIEFISLQKFFITINRIKDIKGKTHLLNLLNDFSVVHLATVLRELIVYYYPTKADKETIFNLDGKDIKVKEFYRICCVIVHINAFNDEMPKDYIRKLDFIGAKIFERCDKTHPNIKECIDLSHAVNHELANLYGFQLRGEQKPYSKT
ncbi:MAG: hypothetical protein VB048_02910 [Bacteroidaceae bacterium]|nr:hypothetical protein [Bacteroidaceae bacterium]